MQDVWVWIFLRNAPLPFSTSLQTLHLCECECASHTVAAFFVRHGAGNGSGRSLLPCPRLALPRLHARLSRPRLRSPVLWKNLVATAICIQLRQPGLFFLCNLHLQILFPRPQPAMLVSGQGVDPESDAFSRITMKYIRDDEELRKHFAAFHVQGIFPRAVIIDDFFDMFDERSCAERFGHMRPRETAMVKTLALCYDAINFANEHGGREAQCHLLVSDSHVGEAPRLRFIYQRWLPQILTIEAVGDSSFCVSLARDEESPASRAVKATYTLLQGRLQLDLIEAHG